MNKFTYGTYIWISLYRKFAGTDGLRYFWDARFITITFDSSPNALRETERLLRNEEGILRFHTLKKQSVLEKCNAKTYKNPYWPIKSETSS